MNLRGMAQCVGLTSMAMILTASCTTVREIHPTKEHPVAACAVSCPYGFALRQQHKCRSDRRWFHDVLLTGEYTSRGVDGTISIDTWEAIDGDYDKRDIIIGTCEMFKTRIGMSEAEQRDPRRD